MRRWIFNIFCGLCLLLAAGVAVLWVRGYWVRDIIGYEVREDIIGEESVSRVTYFAASSGRIAIVYERSTTPSTGPTAFRWYHTRRSAVLLGSFIKNYEGWDALGFGFVSSRYILVVAVPDWFLLLLFSIPPMLWFRHQRRQSRQRRGFEVLMPEQQEPAGPS